MLVSVDVAIFSNVIYFVIIGDLFLFAGYLHPIKNIVNINYKNTGNGGDVRTKTNILYYSSLAVCTAAMASLIFSLVFISKGFTIIGYIIWFMLEVGYLSAAVSRLRIMMTLKKRNTKALNVAFMVMMVAIFFVGESVSLLLANVFMIVMAMIIQRRVIQTRNLPANTPPPVAASKYKEL